MKIFKFGGASILSAERIINVVDIIRSFSEDKLVIVVSAAGKTTNELEKVVEMWLSGDSGLGKQVDKIKAFHFQILESLYQKGELKEAKEKLNEQFHILSSILNKKSEGNYDFCYDQVVSMGEIISTKMLHHYMQKMGIVAEWLDARNLIATDDTYREARIDWDNTSQQIRNKISQLSDHSLFLTQGFIGGYKNSTTTLGREGSDFTASIFGYVLDVEGVYIWKDVAGVLNADPTKFEQVVKIDTLSYRDAIEMTYYGAKVIHPKTIKPLQNKGIPLYVRSFFYPKESGTTIRDQVSVNFVPPVIVNKDDQVLLYLSTKDFSFIAEENLSTIYNLFAKGKIKINMMQNTAISFTVCFDYDEKKLSGLIAALENDYITDWQKGLKLITVKYYNDTLINELKIGNEVILEEKIRNTAQLLMRSVAT